MKNTNENAIPVSDKPAESGITLNNIISFLILCVISWVGINIESIKTTQGALSTKIEVNTTNIEHLATDTIEHKRNHHKL